MTDVVIKRCPVCESIRSHTDGLVQAMKRDMNVTPRVEDGAKGELSVLVDGVPVIQHTSGDLPSHEAIEAAVRNAVPVGV